MDKTTSAYQALFGYSAENTVKSQIWIAVLVYILFAIWKRGWIWSLCYIKPWASPWSKKMLMNRLVRTYINRYKFIRFNQSDVSAQL